MSRESSVLLRASCPSNVFISFSEKENAPPVPVSSVKTTAGQLTAGQFGAQFVHEISPWCGVVVNWVLVLELEILFLIKPNDV